MRTENERSLPNILTEIYGTFFRESWDFISWEILCTLLLKLDIIDLGNDM